jgi:hypothetical protein
MWRRVGYQRTFGSFSDHVHAIDAAIDFAGKDGKAGRPAFNAKNDANRLDL